MSAWLDAPLETISIADLRLERDRREAALHAPLRPALFIDKDGTLVEPPEPDAPADAAVDPARLRFVPGAGESLARLRQAGLALVLVTNESGLARGAFNRAQFARLQTALVKRLRDEFDVIVDDVAVCPHSPDAQGRPACLCRKPAPGMLLRTARAHRLDLARSWMVGDTLDDVEAGHRAGAAGWLLDTGAETQWRRSPMREPDAVFSDWPSLTDQLLAAHAAACAMSEAAGPTTSSDLRALGATLPTSETLEAGAPMPAVGPRPAGAPAQA